MPYSGSDQASVTLLGCFRLQTGSREVPLPLGTQRLVALLALRGRMSRSRLAGTLWPDTAESRALASLRTAIWRVNQAAPGLVTNERGAIDLEPAVIVDVRDVVQHARTVMRGEASLTVSLKRLPENDEDLLPDWEDAWLADERERLRQLRLHVHEALADLLAAEGRFGLALEVALAALRFDTLRESAHRSVIRIHLAEGNISEARRAYAACRQVLEQELGISPAPATTRMLALHPDVLT